MKTISSQATAWMTSATDLRFLDSNPEAVIGTLGYTTGETDMTAHGWIPVGNAEIKISFLEKGDLLMGQIDALRKQQQNVRDKAEMQANRIEQQIQSLLAISYEPA